MKSFFSLVLALVMALSLTTVAWGAATTVTSEQELKDALLTSGEITLGSNIALETGVTIDKGVEITLNLNGKTLSFSPTTAGTTALIKNSGTLIINGDGVITNNALNPDTDWGTEGYPTYANNTITNCGTLVVNSGTIENTSPAGGATYAVDNNSNGVNAYLTVEGGEIVCLNNHAIRQYANSSNHKNVVTINDGLVKGYRAVWIHLPGSKGDEKQASITVNGGTLEATRTSDNHSIYTYSYGDSYNNTSITIDGGTLTGYVALMGGEKVGTPTVSVSDGNVYGVIDYSESLTGIVSGGTFSADPADYVAAGYAVTEADGKYTVTEAAATEAEAKEATTEVTVNTTGMDEAEATIANSFANAGAVEFDDGDVMTDMAEDIAEANIVTEAAAVAALEAEHIDASAGAEVVVQPYYDVQVKAVVVSDSGETTITLDITPKYQVIATTDANAIEVGVNAVNLGDPVVMSIDEPVKITVKIPSALAVAKTDGGFEPLYVTHDDTHVYVADVTENDGKYYATFTATNGFSPFVFSSSNPSVASVGSKTYATVQAAVDAANDGDTVKLLKDSSENITVDKAITIDDNGYSYTGTVKAASGYSATYYTNGNVVVSSSSIVLAGGAVLTLDFDKRDEARYMAWDAKIIPEDSEDAKKNEFATYKIEMIAKINDAPIWWDTGVAKKDKDVDFKLNGEDEFVMVATEDQAEIVIIDGKTITYLARASLYNTNGWTVKAENVTLPYSVPAKYVCDTLYTLNPAATSFYEYNDTLYTASTLGTTGVIVFNVDGVAVAVVPTKVADLSNGAKAAKTDEVVYTGHTYQLDSEGNSYGEKELTKVYCDLCDTSFDFVVGGVAKAIDEFGVDGYVDTGLNWPKNSANNVYVGKTSSGSYLPSRPSGSTTTTTTVVQSAATFDAGIAMYVGMSVMAAAGSAVVLKKKED